MYLDRRLSALRIPSRNESIPKIDSDVLMAPAWVYLVLNSSAQLQGGGLEGLPLREAGRTGGNWPRPRILAMNWIGYELDWLWIGLKENLKERSIWHSMQR